ncbi:Uncharacterized protein QJS10_CPA08g01711 [Acorus calamus]|uniref:NAD-dependent epimerase/dehydratase domain-containing protein n=1 Tax=Acorus calamus TaxID=4465 RepID=A0AAV9E928_ACOCL|nr:Uncharacterized protein QJS10_CPA08g01711 [Acorus calamus]
MRMIVSRLLQSQSQLPRLSALVSSRNARLFSTDSNPVDEPIKVEEAETVNVPPPPSEKLLVLGGNGFVGSHICKEALEHGVTVASLSRSGRTNVHGSWADNVEWHQGVKRFVYISAADFGLVNYLLQGYYGGKRAAEAELLAKFPYGESVM